MRIHAINFSLGLREMIQVLMKTVAVGSNYQEELLSDPMMTSLESWHVGGGGGAASLTDGGSANSWDRFEGSVGNLTDEWISELYSPDGFTNSPGN